MELSIVIVNYNTKDLTLKCIDSINKNPPKVSYEIIVVDNGSTDGSVDSFKNIEGIKLIENGLNLGFAKANNIGIKSAKGKHTLLLNSDTEVKEGSLGKLYEFAERTEDAGVIGPKLLNKDGSIQTSVFHFPSISRAIREYWLGEKGAYGQYAPTAKDSVEVDAVAAAAFLISLEAIQKVGLLDERYFMYFEDLDYCRRVKSEGLKVYYFPSATIVHYLGVSGKSVAETSLQWRRLIPSSKIYNGVLKHYLINFVIWSGQKWQRLLGRS